MEAVSRTPDDEPRLVEEPAGPVTGIAITIAGVELSPGTVAKLALKLHRAGEFALAVHLGRAVDQARPDIPLERDDHHAILRTIADDRSSRFRALRDVLSDRAGDRSEHGPSAWAG